MQPPGVTKPAWLLHTSAGWEVIPGIANFLLCHLPENGPTAAEWVRRCRAHGLYVRDVGGMGRCFGDHALRIAVKDAPTNRRMLEILSAINNHLPTKIEPLLSPQPA